MVSKSKNTLTHLLVDFTDKLVYQLPVEEVEHIKEISTRYEVNEFHRTAFIPHLPVGYTNFCYHSLYAGEINIKDYTYNKRYLIVEDSPAARVLYGSPVNLFMV